MSYKFKGTKVIINGEEQIIEPSTLPEFPQDGYFAIDISDGLLKVYNESKSRWVILGDANNIVFDNSSNGFTSQLVQPAIEEAKNSTISSVYNLTFTNDGSSENKWLELSSGIASNDTQSLIVVNSRIVGLTFSNKRNNVDCDIEVNISNLSEGITINRTLIFEIRNSRTFTSWFSSSTNVNFSLNAGDKISVYIRDRGDNPDDAVVNLFFKTTSESTISTSENYTSSITISIGPITIIF